MKKFAVAAVCTFALVGFVMADEFGANITKVDGSKITYFKTKAGMGKKGGGGKGGGKGFGGGMKDGDAITGDASASVKVVKGMFDMDNPGTFKAGDPIEGGLKNDMFKSIDDAKGINCRITVADDGADKGKITQIMIIGGKKKGG